MKLQCLSRLLVGGLSIASAFRHDGRLRRRELLDSLAAREASAGYRLAGRSQRALFQRDLQDLLSGDLFDISGSSGPIENQWGDVGSNIEEDPEARARQTGKGSGTSSSPRKGPSISSSPRRGPATSSSSRRGPGTAISHGGISSSHGEGSGALPGKGSPGKGCGTSSSPGKASGTTSPTGKASGTTIPHGNGSGPTGTSGKGNPIPPGLQQAMAMCHRTSGGRAPSSPKSGNGSKGRLSKRADIPFIMGGHPVSTTFPGNRLTTTGLCGCWVVAIYGATSAHATHIPHGEGFRLENGQVVQTVTADAQARHQMAQLMATFHQAPIAGAQGYILSHQDASESATQIIASALSGAGLSTRTATYSTAEVANGNGNFVITKTASASGVSFKLNGVEK